MAVGHCSTARESFEVTGARIALSYESKMLILNIIYDGDSEAYSSCKGLHEALRLMKTVTVPMAIEL